MVNKTFNVEWRYNVGDVVWYLEYGVFREGWIQQLKISTDYSEQVIPQYRIQYEENGKFQVSWAVDENLIVEGHSKHLEKLKKLKVEQDKILEKRREIKEKIEWIEHKVKYNK